MNYNKYRSISQYRVIPRLVRVGVEQTVNISPMGVSKRFDDTVEYTVSFVPREIYDADRFGEDTAWDSVRVHSENGTIRVSYVFDSEQEWVLSVTNDAEKEKGGCLLECHIYALMDDLYERTPYRGDLHVHSCRSDGKEDPSIVAANYRKEGFDFLALTDHNIWWPSDEMIRTYADVPLGIKLFHGEEVHVSSWIHIVNFGSRSSVNELYRKNADELNEKIQAEAQTLQTPKGVNALEYAWRKWVCEEIRKAGGLCIVTHPYWVVTNQTYHMSTAMLEYVFETGVYDAFELVGGQNVHENNVQSAFYQEQRAKGRQIPIVGSSDSHGTDPAAYFGIGKTIVFAKELEQESICEAIKGMYSVAIEQQFGEEERVYGSYRMVKYARFLLDQYFPAHDELCVEEGILMREYVLGDPTAADALRAIANRIERHAKEILRGES